MSSDIEKKDIQKNSIYNSKNTFWDTKDLIDYIML